jgi:hypothetical protein
VIIEAVMKVHKGFLFLMAVNVWPIPCYFKESGIEQEKLFIQNAVHFKHLARTVILRNIVCSILHRIIVCACTWGDSEITATEAHKNLNKKLVAVSVRNLGIQKVISK